jgi:hypothetical protein
MPFLNCPECSSLVEADAAVCRSCGYPLNKVPDPPAREPSNMRRNAVSLALVALLGVIVYTQLTIFVIQPIGALPEGKTLVIARLNVTEFVDSPDAMCERIQHGVSLICRAMVMGTVLQKSTILLRLPYSSVLYDISTGGKTYDR